ncbi:MAG: OmpA family protein, partial [Bacteroidota bacterium]
QARYMRTFVVGFLLFIVYALGARWYFMCEIRQQCEDKQEVILKRPQTLTLRYQDSILLEGYDQFWFAKDSIRPDLNMDNRRFISDVFRYFDYHPEQNLTIMGRMLESEVDAPAGFFENIALARAAQVELLLESAGMERGRIYLDYETIAYDTLWEPMDLFVANVDSNRLQELQFSFEDMTYPDANFEYNSAVFTPGEGFLNYADSVQVYLDQNPDYRMRIIGHTDSIASQAYNEDLGMRRAESVAIFFRDRGVSAEIMTQSMGETDPVAPNTVNGEDNPDGRHKNRRVNLKLELSEVN